MSEVPLEGSAQASGHQEWHCSPNWVNQAGEINHPRRDLCCYQHGRHVCASTEAVSAQYLGGGGCLQKSQAMRHERAYRGTSPIRKRPNP